MTNKPATPATAIAKTTPQTPTCLSIVPSLLVDVVDVDAAEVADDDEDPVEVAEETPEAVALNAAAASFVQVKFDGGVKLDRRTRSVHWKRLPSPCFMGISYRLLGSQTFSREHSLPR